MIFEELLYFLNPDKIIWQVISIFFNERFYFLDRTNNAKGEAFIEV